MACKVCEYFQERCKVCNVGFCTERDDFVEDSDSCLFDSSKEEQENNNGKG